MREKSVAASVRRERRGDGKVKRLGAASISIELALCLYSVGLPFFRGGIHSGKRQNFYVGSACLLSGDGLRAGFDDASAVREEKAR